MAEKLLGSIEGGGTKFICAVMNEAQAILREERIPTESPELTLANCIRFFSEAAQDGLACTSIGVACFGPLDPRPGSSTYGKILATPKPGWAYADLAGTLERGLGIPVILDSDVNGAVLAESLWGAGIGLKNLVYFTIGTGIGGGAIIENKLVHGLMHPEMGHMVLRHDFSRDSYAGCCPFHRDCFEGLASGPAIGARWGKPAAELPAGHPAWELEADYIAQAIMNITLTLMPERIILGGGVMEQKQLFPLIRKKLLGYLNGYLRLEAILKGIENYVVPSGLQGKAGLYGGLALALQAG